MQDQTYTPSLLVKEQVAKRLNRSPRAIAQAAWAGNEALVPLPIKIGRRWFWRPEDVDAWIAAQAAAQAVSRKPSSSSSPAPAPKRRGAPTKVERRAKAQAAAFAEAKAAQASQTSGEGA